MPVTAQTVIAVEQSIQRLRQLARVLNEVEALELPEAEKEAVLTALTKRETAAGVALKKACEAVTA